MKTRYGSFQLLTILGFTLAGSALAQTPTITGPLTSSLHGEFSPTRGNAITYGSPVEAFALYIPGSFSPSQVYRVRWTNTETGFEGFLGQGSFRSVAPGLIAVNIPGNIPGYYNQGPVTSPQRVNISVEEFIPQTESLRSSNAAPFFINPFPVTTDLTRSITLGQAFATDLVSSGTPPYTSEYYYGTAPPGVLLRPAGLSGIPTTAGVYEFLAMFTDVWGNTGYSYNTIQVVPVPSITVLNPSFVFAPSGNVQVQITGSGFVQQVQLEGEGSGSVLFPGTEAHWLVGTSDIVLTTQVVNPNLILAMIPASLLTTPLVAQIRVAQPSGAVSNSLPFTVVGPLTITTSSLPDGTVGVPYSGAVAVAEAIGAVNWFAQNLPAGLQLDPVTGAITGTPSPDGTRVITFTVTDSLQRSATRNIPLTINPGALSITTASLPSGTANVAYSATAAATGGTPPYGWTAQGLPSGLSIGGASGVIGGTTASFGSFPVTIRVSDSGSRTASRSYTLAIGPPALSITTTVLPAGIRGVAYSTTLVASGGQPPLVWSAQGLPGGLTLNTSTGAITGTPAASGTSQVAVTVTDAASQTANRTFSLVIAAPTLSIATSSLPGGRQTVAYNAAVVAAGGSPPFSWTATQLPPGVVLNSSTGALTGTPTATGTFQSRFTVSDASQQSASATLPIVISEPPTPTLDIIGPGTLPPGTVNIPYTAGLQITGGVPGYTTVVVAGSLPAGLSLVPEGAIGGIPTTPGTSRFSVRVTDSAGTTAFKDYVLLINPAPLTVTGTVQTVPRDSAINVRFGATGGLPPYQFSATGAIPTGTTFVNGLLSGTASASGTFTFNVTATDSVGVSANRSFTIVVGPPALTLTGSAGDGQVGVAYTAQFGATGGVPPYTFAATGLPGGLSFAGSAISGTPTAAGTSSVAVTVTDATGAQASQTFSVTVTAAALQITTASLPGGTSGSAYSASLAATGGVPPYTFAVAGLPSTLSASTAGVISGTPDAAGTFNLTATVTDSTGVSTSRSLTLTVAPPPLSILTGSVPSGTVGTAVSLTFQASGGVPPYTWSAAGLPANLILSGAGVLSGSPASAGTTSFSVAVSDSTGASVNRQFSFTAGLPAAPALSLTGLPATSNPASQSSLGVGITTPFPLPVTVDLTLTFAADVGADDPTVQFAGGGRTARVTIPAGSTAALNSVGLQVGTVAGTATITARLSAGGQDLTPTPVPTRTVRINGGPPVISSVTATRTTNGLTVTITGFATTRSVSTANFTFTAAAGSTLQTAQLSVTVDGLFSAFFQSAGAAATGSQFTFTQPFTTSGAGTVASVAVTLANAAGTSNSVSANVP